jgi:alkanesulfonate monooxygenase SsuD/methylene tetrahydromethanopterin reductase-like flavin-dependent oxidoreductase (luciferase family)
MIFGLTIFPTDYSIAPAELGRAAEDAGFESLFFAEHTHIPVSRESPRPGGGRSSTGTRTTRSSRWRPSPRPPTACGSAPASA